MQRVPSCAYCFKPYAFKGSGRPIGQRIPRLLTCGHTFCDGCISKLAELHPREIPCPTCERKTTLPGGKKQIKELSTNLYILGVLINNVRAALEKDVTKGELSDFDLQEGFNFIPGEECASTSGGASVEENAVCEECCTVAATSECAKCEAIFCKPCFITVHSSSRTLRSHEAVPISKRLLGGVDNGCSSHDGKELEFYDKTDEKLLCSLCVVSPQCQGHETVPIGDVCEKVKKGLEDVKKIHSKLQQSRGKLSHLFPGIKAECGESIQQIKEHFQDLHTRLQAREADLIQEVKTAYCNKSFLVETAKEIVQQSKELETVIDQSRTAFSSHSLFMENGEELLSKLTAAKDTPCVLSKMSVHDIIQVSYSDAFHDALQSYGAVVAKSGSLQLKKLSEEPEEADDIAIQDDDDDSTIITVEMEDSAVEASPTRVTRATTSLPPRQNLIYVTHIKNPCDFMVQHAADEERLENLMNAVNQYSVGAKSLNEVVKSTEVGDLVCAQYSKDQYWYRARVIGQQQRPSAPKSQVQPLPHVEVCFIDYGNTELVPLNRLRKIRPEFTDIPELATNCSLIDIVPPMQNGTWPTQSIKAFGSLTRDKALLMSVMRRCGGKLYVDLRSPAEEPTHDDDKPASVRDALVFLDVARFKSPASVANPKASYPMRSYKDAMVLEEGETMEVVVTYTENPGAMYVMKESGYADTMKIINQMVSMYSMKKGNQWKIMWPYKGLVCAARFSGDKVWYRALVTDVVGDQLVQVTYVDFGNSEELPFSEIRRIPDHMVQLPMQAIQCSLALVKPIDQESGWSNDCNAFLSDVCTLNRYRMKVIESKEGQPLSVILYEMDVHQGTSLNGLLLTNLHAAITDAAEFTSLHSDNTKDSEEISISDASDIHNSSHSADESEKDMPSKNVEGNQMLFLQKLMYKPVQKPAQTKFEFAVTYVDEDCTISGYHLESGDKSLPELMKHVQNICSSDSGTSVSQDQLSFNQPCCAQFSEDNLWYRAEVVDFPSPSTVLVDYVDFGNREEIPLTSIKLNAAFLEIPKQCLSVQVEGLLCNFDEKEKVSKYLSQLLVGQMCVATIKKKSLKQVMVKCIQLTLSDGTDIVQLVNDKMSEEDAKEVSKESESSAENHDVPAISKKSGLVRSLISDTCLPEEGIAFDVTVTQVDTPNIVFLQRIPPTEDDQGYADDSDPTVHIANDHLLQLEDISERINTPDYFDGKPEVKNVWENMLCCACYTQDELWYRAQIMTVESTNPLEVRVLYFDYGTSEVIGIDRLKSFPSELLTLPKQAIRCLIVGLQDPTDQDTDSIMEAVDTTIKAVAGKKLICRVLNFNSPIKVELFERVFNEDSYEDVPLHQTISELELMIHINAQDFKQDVVSNVKDEEEPSSETPGDEEPGQEYLLQKDEDDDDPEEEFVLHRSLQDDEEKEEVDVKCSEQFVEIPKPVIQVQHPKLLTPAEFSLKSKDVVVPHPKNTPVKDEMSDKD